MTNYRSLLKQTWQICKTHKFLWVFGFFSLLLGSGGEFNLSYNLSRKIENRSIFMFNLKNFYQFQELKIILKGLFSSPSMILLTFLSLVLIILLVWLTIVSQGAVTDAIKKIKDKKETNFKQSFKIGNGYFWPILGLNIVLKIIVFLCSIIIIGPFILLLLAKNNSSWGNIATILSFLLLIPVSIIISFVGRYALCYIVLTGKNITQSIKSGLRLFIKNWLITIETALILFLTGIAAGILFVVLFLILSIIFSLFAFAFNFLNFSFGVSVVMTLLLALLFFVFLVITSFFGAFYYGYWTLLFTELNKKGDLVSKLIRIFHH